MQRLIRAMLILSVCVPLVATATAPAGAAFPGRNGLIAWSKVFFSRDAEIFVMAPDGSHQRPLTNNDRTDFDPAWSADGSKLAYSSSGADADVWVINADGTGEHDVSNDPDGPDIQPAWSSDGSMIAFIKQNFGGTSALWVMDADGSNQKPLTDAETINIHPNWSPDGTELWKMDANGSNVVQLTIGPYQGGVDPDWQPRP